MRLVCASRSIQWLAAPRAVLDLSEARGHRHNQSAIAIGCGLCFASRTPTHMQTTCAEPLHSVRRLARAVMIQGPQSHASHRSRRWARLLFHCRVYPSLALLSCDLVERKPNRIPNSIHTKRWLRRHDDRVRLRGKQRPVRQRRARCTARGSSDLRSGGLHCVASYYSPFFMMLACTPTLAGVRATCRRKLGTEREGTRLRCSCSEPPTAPHARCEVMCCAAGGDCIPEATLFAKITSGTVDLGDDAGITATALKV